MDFYQLVLFILFSVVVLAILDWFLGHNNADK